MSVRAALMRGGDCKVPLELCPHAHRNVLQAHRCGLKRWPHARWTAPPADPGSYWVEAREVAKPERLRDLIGSHVRLTQRIELKTGEVIEAGAEFKVVSTHRGKFTLEDCRRAPRCIYKVLRSDFEIVKPGSFRVTDPDCDAPDGAVVDGYERVGDRWEKRDG